MKYTVRYIPLNKIKPEWSAALSRHAGGVRRLLWDCMHLMAVRKNRKDGNYFIVEGHARYEYLRKHTNKKYAPCIVDDRQPLSDMRERMLRFRNRKLFSYFPGLDPDRFPRSSWGIIRSFLRQEPRFRQLTIPKQIRVLLFAVRYKRTAVNAMKQAVEKLLSEE